MHQDVGVKIIQGVKTGKRVILLKILMQLFHQTLTIGFEQLVLSSYCICKFDNKRIHTSIYISMHAHVPVTRQRMSGACVISDSLGHVSRCNRSNGIGHELYRLFGKDVEISHLSCHWYIMLYYRPVYAHLRKCFVLLE